MEEYHIIKGEDYNIIFFPTYKQAITIQKSNISRAEVEDVVKQLKKKGWLYVSEERSACDRTWGLYLCVANMCNASCVYCFANKGNYGKVKG